MTIDDKYRLYEEIEKAFDVEQWRYDDVDLWPILKSRIHFYNSGVTSAHIQPTFRWGDYVHAALSIVICLFRKILRLDSVVFLSGDTSRKYYKGRPVSELLFSKMQSLTDEGVSYICTEVGVQPSGHRTFFGDRIHSITRMSKFLQVVWPWRFKPALLDYPAHHVASFLQDRNYNDSLVHIFRLASVTSSLADLYRVRRTYESILLHRRIEEIYLINSYAPTSMALISGARNLGVRVTEIQHGVMTHHTYYCKWSQVPRAGYTVFPHRVELWDTTSYDHLASMSLGGVAIDRIVTSHPWLSNYDAIKDRYPAWMDIYRVDSSKTNVLISLQPIEPMLPSHFDTWLQQKEIIWHLRLHPSQLASEAVKKELHYMFSGTTYNIDEASIYPLVEVLSQMDYHMTMWSSCVIEADLLSVPSILLHEKGVQLFGEYLTAKKAVTSWEAVGVIQCSH